jgi:DNA-binding IclR family transcriptional regulator
VGFERKPVVGRYTMMTFGPSASVIRRRLGPIAWAALECLAGSAVDCAGESVSFASVRGIATELGLAKDTVARALRRLADEELAIYVASRHRDGRFGPSHYLLSFPSNLFGRCPTVVLSASIVKPARRSNGQSPVQLSLIDAFALDV